MCEKGEQYTNCKGQEMEVSAFTQGMGSKLLDQLCRGFIMTGGQPAWELPIGSASSRQVSPGEQKRSSQHVE